MSILRKMVLMSMHRKRKMMLRNLKKKEGKSYVECVYDVLRKWVYERAVRMWWM